MATNLIKLSNKDYHTLVLGPRYTSIETLVNVQKIVGYDFNKNNNAQLSDSETCSSFLFARCRPISDGAIVETIVLNLYANINDDRL